MKKSSAKVRLRFYSVILFLLVLIVFAVSSCTKDCNHEWKDATCTEPKTCTLCGKTEGGALGHTYGEAVTVEPNCTENGSRTSICHCGDTKVEVIAAKGHAWDKDAATCTEGRTCSVCQLKEDKTGHNYALKAETQADCLNPATKTYECANCKDKYTENIGVANGHSVSTGVQREDKTGTGCDYIQIHVCTKCKVEISGATVQHHEYKATITKEATCVSDGIKTFKCSGCNAEFTEAIAKNTNSHNWNNGTLSGSIRTYKCTNTGCKATKTVVDATTKTKASVKSSDLAAAGGIKLKNAGIDFGSAALDTLKNKDLTISSDVLSQNDIKEATKNLSEEKKALLGDNPTIYDFKVTESGNAISDFGGEITVTIPYTLKNGEDVDKIAVWYMSGETPELIRAEYSNGNITFKTTHFSLYTVGPVSDEDRCALYGHTYDATEVAGDCLTDSYKIEICRYCNDTINTITKKAIGHSYVETVEAATCTTDGKTTFKCSACDAEYSTKINATGHNYVVSWTWSEDKATAIAQFVCSHDSTHTQGIAAAITSSKETLADHGEVYTYNATVTFEGKEYTDKAEKLVSHTHSYGEWKTTEPTCTTAGLKQRTCVCGSAETETIAALQHDYKAIIIAPTCTAKGYTSHTCSKCNDTYIDTETDMVSHNYGEWTTTQEAKCDVASTREKVCTVCKDKVTETLAALNHSYEAVVTAPTCTENGYTTHTCSRCKDSYIDTEVAALNHNYKAVVTAPTCTKKGYTTHTCSRCKDSYIDTEVAALNHDNEEIVGSHYGLSKYGYCEGEVEIAKYKICGTITEIYGGGCCTIEDSIDEDGYTIYTCENKKGCFRKKKTVKTKVDQCTTLVETYHKFYDKKGAEVLSLYYSSEEYKHEYGETSFELINKKLGCTGGVKITEICKCCGYVYERTYYDHIFDYTCTLAPGSTVCADGIVLSRKCQCCGLKLEDVTIESHYSLFLRADLTKSSGICECTLEIIKCALCGDIFSAYPVKQCGSYVKTIDGLDIYYCKVCGCTLKLGSFERNEGCSTIRNTIVQIIGSDGQIEFSDDFQSADTHHQWTYSSTKILNAKIGCTGGVETVKKCTRCGETDKVVFYDHHYSYSYEFVTEIQNCASGVRVGNYCDFCGKSAPNSEPYVTTDHFYDWADDHSLEDYGFCENGVIQYGECLVCGDSTLRLDGDFFYHRVSGDINSATGAIRCTDCGMAVFISTNTTYANHIMITQKDVFLVDTFKEKELFKISAKQTKYISD